MSDLNTQAQKFIDEQHFDAESIREKQRSVNERYAQLKQLAAGRRSQLHDSMQLQELYRDMDEEEAWIRSAETPPTTLYDWNFCLLSFQLLVASLHAAD